MGRSPSNTATIRHEQGGFPASASGIAPLLGRVIFTALLSIIVLTAIPYGTVERWWVALFECAVLALTILWLIEGALGGGWLVRSHILLLPLLILIFFCSAQTIPSATSDVAGLRVSQTISADPYQTRLVALELLALTLAAAMLLRYTSSPRRMRALVYTIIGVGLISALFGLVRQTTQQDTPDFILPYLRRELGYGQFINKNHFAFLMEMTLGLSIGIAVGGIERSQILIYLALALPVWTALVLANSRGGLFSMLAQVLFLGFLFVSLRPARDRSVRGETHGARLMRGLRHSILFKTALLIALTVIVLVGAIWMGGEPLVNRLETVSNEVGSANVKDGEGASRIAIWRATWRMFKAHPIAGVGFGGYRTAIPQYHNASGQITPREAHNDYLELLASGGIIGAGLLILFLAVFIMRVRERLRRASGFSRAAIIGALAGLFGVAVHSFVDFGLHITINALVFMALLVVACGTPPDEGTHTEAALNARY
ncbi:MAG TPA: O-antigen ligase family protein [Pyrinomonadaceae bacterium]|jgi:O-antigen ligase